jgi:hypothetical protein
VSDIDSTGEEGMVSRVDDIAAGENREKEINKSEIGEGRVDPRNGRLLRCMHA